MFNADFWVFLAAVIFGVTVWLSVKVFTGDYTRAAKIAAAKIALIGLAVYMAIISGAAVAVIAGGLP